MSNLFTGQEATQREVTYPFVQVVVTEDKIVIVYHTSSISSNVTILDENVCKEMVKQWLQKRAEKQSMHDIARRSKELRA